MAFPLWVIVMLRSWIVEDMREAWRFQIEGIMLMVESYGCEWLVQAASRNI
jgi:hypothetical protein